MKKVLIFLIISIINSNLSYCQLSDGSTVPDFTFTDINGNTQNLYSYLNAGKYVAVDVSTTWCDPCWLYHNSGEMDSLYTLHDLQGDQTWKVLFIEGDGNTTLADLQGTGTNTKGDWITGSQFPIMNPSGVALNDFLSAYNVSFFPTLFIVCPDKKIHQDTLNLAVKPSVNTWEYVANSLCNSSGLNEIKTEKPLTIFPNPAQSSIAICFSINNPTEIKLTISNSIGQIIDTKNFGTLSPGDQSLKVEVNNYKAGMYFFTLSKGENRVIREKVIVNYPN